MRGQANYPGECSTQFTSVHSLFGPLGLLDVVIKHAVIAGSLFGSIGLFDVAIYLT